MVCHSCASAAPVCATMGRVSSECRLPRCVQPCLHTPHPLTEKPPQESTRRHARVPQHIKLAASQPAPRKSLAPGSCSTPASSRPECSIEMEKKDERSVGRRLGSAAFWQRHLGIAALAAPRPEGLRGLLATVGDDRQEAVVANLDGVDVQDALGRWDEAEVDGMSQRPHLPAAHHRG